VTHGAPGDGVQGAPVPVVDRPRLEPLVARVLGRPAGVTDWQGHAVYGGYGAASGGVYRFRGHARAGGGDRPLPWSLVLKVVRPSPRASEAPAAWGYWKREALAYRSGLLADLPGGIAAPRCYGVDEGDDAAWLWLEDLTDAAGAVWPLDQFGHAARHLGAFHGAYLAARPLPAAPWLCRDWLRTWLGRCAGGMERLAAARDEAAVRRYWPGDVYERALRLWGEREAFLAALERVPQTVGHGDYKRPNLFARTGPGGTRRTVAIDWANVGIAPLGLDLAHLVAWSCLFFAAEPADLPELDRAARAHYADGLRAAGWRGDARLVELAQAAATGLLAGVHPWGATAHSEAQRAAIERAWGRPYDEAAERNARVRAFALDRADAARALLPRVR